MEVTGRAKQSHIYIRHDETLSLPTHDLIQTAIIPQSPSRTDLFRPTQLRCGIDLTGRRQLLAWRRTPHRHIKRNPIQEVSSD